MSYSRAATTCLQGCVSTAHSKLRPGSVIRVYFTVTRHMLLLHCLRSSLILKYYLLSSFILNCKFYDEPNNNKNNDKNNFAVEACIPISNSVIIV